MPVPLMLSPSVVKLSKLLHNFPCCTQSDISDKSLVSYGRILLHYKHQVAPVSVNTAICIAKSVLCSVLVQVNLSLIHASLIVV